MRTQFYFEFLGQRTDSQGGRCSGSMQAILKGSIKTKDEAGKSIDFDSLMRSYEEGAKKIENRR